MNGVSDFFNIFFGSTQSQITAYAIFAAIIAICITILLTKTDMNFGDKLLLIFFILLTLIPGVFLILFEITCMVTGGNKDKRWWCWLYAWVVAVFVIIYCILVIIISFSSLFTYNNAIENIEINENKNKMSQNDSNEYAAAIIKSNEFKESFENNNLQQTLESLLKKADDTEKRADEGFLANSTEMINAIPEGKHILNKQNDPQISSFTNVNNEQESQISSFANFNKQNDPQISSYANDNKQHIPEISSFANLNKQKDHQISSFVNHDKQQQLSSFYGGNYATYETFANKKKSDDEKPKEKSKEKEKEQIKSEFKGSVSLDDDETETDTKMNEDKKETVDDIKEIDKEEEAEASVEPFTNMNFATRYSRY